MCVHVLEAVVELKGVDIAQTILNIAVDNELYNSKNFTAKVKGVTKTRFLTLFGGEGFDRLEIEVVVQVQVVEVLSVDQ